MGQNHKRHYETAPTWMIERLQHQVATNDLIAYGNAELLLAAESGAVEALLIGEHETCDDTIVASVRQHGGNVIYLQAPNKELDMLKAVALLRFSLCIVDDHEAGNLSRQASNSKEELTPPKPSRTLTYYAPTDAPVQPASPSDTIADELDLLISMFAEERKLRMLSQDGTRFLLHVDAGEPSSYLILEFALPASYPECPPVVTAPFGQLDHHVLSVDEAAEAAASACAVVDADPGSPVLYSIYDAAREWISSAAAAA